MSEPICELLPNGRYASAAVMEDIDRLERESAAKDAQLAALREALESVAVYADDLLPHIADDVRNALALVRAEPPLKSGDAFPEPVDSSGGPIGAAVAAQQATPDSGSGFRRRVQAALAARGLCLTADQLAAINEFRCCGAGEYYSTFEDSCHNPANYPGWRLVPTEPTEDMLLAGKVIDGRWTAGNVWALMVAAAPKLPERVNSEPICTCGSDCTPGAFHKWDCPSLKTRA